MKTWDDAASHWLGVYDSYVRERISVYREKWDCELAEQLRSTLSTYVIGFRDADSILASTYDRLAERAVEALDREKVWNWQDMLDLLVSKQKDYGVRNIEAFGHIGIVVRLSDKVARIENLMKREITPTNESLLDSFRDVVGYCVVARLWSEGTFYLPLDEAGLVSGEAA